MKKIFTQLGQWILKHKKRLIYGALALFIGQICFFNLGGLGGTNNVFAQSPETPTQNSTFQQKATNWSQNLLFIQRVFYFLLYPILGLAGVLVNNSFVYAEVFQFDAVLWQLWNVVRNMANYALGFIFVFKIFQFLLNGQKSSDMLKLLKSTLIAGIGIQASWFLLAVLIDISNILAYGIGGLPIKMLGQQANSDNFGNPYVFRTVVYTDTDTQNGFEYYLSTTSGDKKFISECRTFSFSYDSGSNKISEELILAPKMVYYYDGYEYKTTEQTACHIGDDVYYFQSLYDGDPKIERPEAQCSGTGCKDIQINYSHSVDNVANSLVGNKKLNEMKDLISKGSILEIGDAHAGKTDLGIKYGTGDQYGLDVDNNWKGESFGLQRLNDVLSGNYVGVFTALYSSLLNAGTDLTVSEVKSAGIYTSLLSVILSLCHTIAIGIPLIAMLVVFLMRIGVIWMAIVLSPIIILLKAFGFEDSVEKKVDIFKYLRIKNLIGIIFSPAIICFAVSISTVLVRVINTVNMQDVITKDSYVLGGLIKLNIAGLGLNIGRLVCCIIGVAISWFLIWSAVKSSEIGKSEFISGKKGLKGIAESALGSVPIIPVPKKGGGIDFVGTRTAFGGDGQGGIFSKISSELKDKYTKNDNDAIADWFKSDEELQKDAKNAAARQFSTYKEKLFANFGADWQNMQIRIGEEGNKNGFSQSFGGLTADQQEAIIKEINSKGKDELAGISDGDTVVLKSGKTYKFVTTRQKVNADGKGLVDGNNNPIMDSVYKYEEQKTS